MIIVCHLIYRRRLARGEVSRSWFRLPFATPLSWLVIAFLVFLTVILGVEAENRIALYTVPLWAAVLIGGYLLAKPGMAARDAAATVAVAEALKKGRTERDAAIIQKSTRRPRLRCRHPPGTRGCPAPAELDAIDAVLSTPLQLADAQAHSGSGHLAHFRRPEAANRRDIGMSKLSVTIRVVAAAGYPYDPAAARSSPPPAAALFARRRNSGCVSGPAGPSRKV